MANYEIILKLFYTVEDVKSEEEAYKKAVEMMKKDTVLNPCGWEAYPLPNNNNKEKKEDKKPSLCPPNTYFCCKCSWNDTELCPFTRGLI